MRVKVKSLCCLAVMAAFAGCGGGGGSGDSAPAPAVPSVKKAPALCPTSDNGANYECPAMTGFNGDESDSVSTQGNARVERIEFAQLNLKQPDSQYFVAVANREALIRVVVTADAGQSNLKAPALKLTLTNQDSGAVVKQIVLQPATSQMVLPTTGDAVDPARGNPTVPDFYRSYLYRLQAADLPAANLQLKAEIDTVASGIQDTVYVDNAKIVNITPVAVPTLKLVTVPVNVSNTSPTIPPDDRIKDSIMQFLPISNIEIRRHDAFNIDDTVLGGIEPSKYQYGPSRALSLIDWDQRGNFSSLPKSDRSNGEIYIGFVKGDVGGYTNQYTNTILASDQMFPGNEPTLAIVPHEIMHVLKFNHQEICGAVNGSPEYYPYSDFGIGASYGINLSATSIKLKSNYKYKSFMGYCYPGYISDYHVDQFVYRMNTTNF